MGDLISSGKEYEPLGYYFGIHVLPDMRLEKRDGIAFAGALAAHTDLESIELESSEWRFTAAKSDLSVIVWPNRLEFQCSNPSRGAEWYEQKYRLILNDFDQQMEPEVVTTSKAMVRALVSVPGEDAREFLASEILSLDNDRLGKFERPIHVIGVTLKMPRFRVEGEGEDEAGEDSNVKVKIESSPMHPNKVFVEVDVTWFTPKPWTENDIDEFVSRLTYAQDLLRTKVLHFLRFNQRREEE